MSGSLDPIIEGYLDLRWQLDPVAATAAGVHEHDPRLADRSAAGVRAMAAAIRAFASSLEEGEAETVDEAIDQTAALNAARTDLQVLERWRPFARDPGWHLRHLLDGLFYLLLTVPDDPEARTAALVARLEAAPGFLQAAREALTDPAPVHVETARALLPGALDLVRHGLLEAPLDLSVLEPGKLEVATNECVDALIAFGDWLALATETASGDFALGRALYDRMLHTAHLIQGGADELARYGERLRAETEAELQRLAEELEPGASWQELADRIDADAEPDDVLGFVRAAAEASREFVEEHGLLPEAPGEMLVEATPPYLRPLVPIAAYVPPGPADPGQTGRFLVTPAGEEGRRGAGAAQLAVVAVHEAVPGHHAHLTLANANPRLARRLLSSPVTVEGWALYCETMMAEQGFFVDPWERFAALRMLRWRAIRIELDVGLHTRGLSPDEAVARLRDEVGLEPAAALAEVRRQCAMPTYAACYATGRREILALREWAQASRGSDFSLRAFHAELMGYGRLPLALARWGMGAA